MIADPLFAHQVRIVFLGSKDNDSLKFLELAAQQLNSFSFTSFREHQVGLDLRRDLGTVKHCGMWHREPSSVGKSRPRGMKTAALKARLNHHNPLGHAGLGEVALDKLLRNRLAAKGVLAHKCPPGLKNFFGESPILGWRNRLQSMSQHRNCVTSGATDCPTAGYASPMQDR